MKVLIVDDSAVYRSKIRAALSTLTDVEVVGTAGNGKIALEMMEQKSVDLITLDMEMPVMDGLTTLKELRKRDRRTKVIMFSSSTVRGSEATMDALTCGADDFVAKPAAAATTNSPEEVIRDQLFPKIKQFIVAKAVSEPATVKKIEPAQPKVVRSPYLRKELDTFRPLAIVIASSTGGPAAHDTIFRGLHGALRCPILIAQHMPPLFTTSFAKRIADLSGIPCREGVHGEEVKNQIYVAPGDFHMTVKKEGERVLICLDKQAARNSVRPAADFLFETAASVYRASCMGFVLTGMGEDGLAGCKAIKEISGGVMIQDEKSCIVFGMPGAVHAASLYDGMGDLAQIQGRLKRMAIA